MREPQSAGDYDDRTTTAVRSVLIEIGQILGGAVPRLLLSGADMPHIGTGDVGLALDLSALGNGEYVRLVEALREHGYDQRDSLRRFQLVRTVPARDDGPDTEAVYVALVSPRTRSVRWFPASVPQCVVDRPDSPRSPSQDCGHWVRLVSAPSVYPEKRSG